MQEADDLCDRIGIISDGEMISLDEPDNLKKQYNKDGLEEVYLELVGDKHE